MERFQPKMPPRLIRALVAILGASMLLGALPAGAKRQDRARSHGWQWRIVGGDQVIGGDLPWTAALVDHGEKTAYRGFFCGAAIVGAQAVVTAAHCVLGLDETEVDVVAGRGELAGAGGTRAEVATIETSDQFEPAGDPGHDVAVLTLKEPLTVPAVRIATPAEDRRLTAAGSFLTVAGWGLTDEGSGARPSFLQRAQVVALSASKCRRAYGDAFLGKLLVCAGGSKGGLPDSCRGDSGGPLVADEGESARLVGLVSFGGPRCGLQDYPGGYTRLSEDFDWLRTVLNAPPPPIPDPTAPEPAPPARPPLNVRILDGSKGVGCAIRTCHIDLSVTGDTTGLAKVLVRIRRNAGSIDRFLTAKRRRSGPHWRAYVGVLYGRLRVSAFGVTSSGGLIGQADRLTVSISRP